MRPYTYAVFQFFLFIVRLFITFVDYTFITQFCFSVHPFAPQVFNSLSLMHTIFLYRHFAHLKWIKCDRTDKPTKRRSKHKVQSKKLSTHTHFPLHFFPLLFRQCALYKINIIRKIYRLNYSQTQLSVSREPLFHLFSSFIVSLAAADGGGGWCCTFSSCNFWFTRNSLFFICT